MISPIFCLMFLTIIVLLIIPISRRNEMMKNRIHPQKIANRKQASELLQDSRASDNLLNLFETPIIFYVVSILFIIKSNYTSFSISLAWIYVVLRTVHSFIQCTYNKVIHRFYVFVLSVFILIIFMVNFLVNS